MGLPNIRINGRFYTTLPISDEDVRRTTTSGTRGSIVPVIAHEARISELSYLSTLSEPAPEGPFRYYCADYVDPITCTGNLIPGRTGWVPAPAVGRFFSVELHPELNATSTDVQTGVLSISQDATGSTLTITLRPSQGDPHSISFDLDCVTLDGGTVVCKPS